MKNTLEIVQTSERSPQAGESRKKCTNEPKRRENDSKTRLGP